MRVIEIIEHLTNQIDRIKKKYCDNCQEYYCEDCTIWTEGEE